MWGHGDGVGATTITISSSGAAVGGRVVGAEAVHLQRHRALGGVPGDGGATFDRRPVVCATTAPNTRDELEPLPGRLSCPDHGVAPGGEAGDLAEEVRDPPGVWRPLRT